MFQQFVVNFNGNRFRGWKKTRLTWDPNFRLVLRLNLPTSCDQAQVYLKQKRKLRHLLSLIRRLRMI